MIGRIALGLALAGLAGAGSSQPLPPPGFVVTIEMLRAEFVARSGSDSVYFAGTSHTLDPAARLTLSAQAAWLRLHPEIIARVDGQADQTDTRDHALAVGQARAEAVRDFLLLKGVPAAQLTAATLGKERPVVAGSSEAAAAFNRRAVTVLVR